MLRGEYEFSCKISKDFIETHILSLNTLLPCDLKAVELPLSLLNVDWCCSPLIFDQLWILWAAKAVPESARAILLTALNPQQVQVALIIKSD